MPYRDRIHEIVIDTFCCVDNIQKSHVEFILTIQLFLGGLISYLSDLCLFAYSCGGHRGCDHMVVRFTTTCAISAM